MTAEEGSGCGGWNAATNATSCPDGTGRPTPTDALSADVWQLLGCAGSPGDAEVEEIWSLNTGRMLQPTLGGPKPPARASIKRRLKLIHSLRMERVTGTSRHGLTITNVNSAQVHHHKKNNGLRQPFFLEKALSMIDDPLANIIGQGIEPIPIRYDDDYDGYDSDPELNRSFNSPRPSYSQLTSFGQHEVIVPEPLPFNEKEIRQNVQVRDEYIDRIHPERLSTQSHVSGISQFLSLRPMPLFLCSVP
jgi:hypothetical protein